MLEENIHFKNMDELGEMHNYTILDRFTKNNKNYLIYQEDGNEDLLASLYEYQDDKLKLIPIEDEKDFDIVDEYLENL